MLDLLATKELVDGSALEVRWVPSAHQLADMLTKDMAITKVVIGTFEEKDSSLIQDEAAGIQELHLGDLRRAQRARRKLRLKGDPEAKI